jgi:hypothetical protein
MGKILETIWSDNDEGMSDDHSMFNLRWASSFEARQLVAARGGEPEGTRPESLRQNPGSPLINLSSCPETPEIVLF